MFVFGFVFAEIFVFFRSSAQYHTARSQQPLLTTFAEIFVFFQSSVQYHTARSHSILRGVNSHFLKLLHRPLKGQCHKTNMYSDKAKKGHHSPMMKLFFDSAQYDTARSQFFRY